jgi:hypothetical protein
MKIILPFIISFLLFFGTVAQNTITTGTLVQTSFCAGGNIIVNYTSTGTFPLGCTFTAQLSDNNGSFANPVTLGSMPLNTGIITGTIPSNTPFGILYKVRVVADNPATIGSNSTTPMVITSTAATATIIANPSTAVCQGDTISLWVTYNAAYHWSTGETSQTIYVADSGTYYVTVTNYLTSCEVTSNPIHITIHPRPPVHFGPDKELCDGQSISLNAGFGYTSYLWNNGSTAQSQVVDSTGTYSVTVHDSYNCVGGDTIKVLFHHNPVVNLGKDTSLCGNSLLLTAGVGYTTYNWNNGLSFNPTLLVDSTGRYIVMVTDSNGCSDRDTIMVHIHSLPLINLGNDLSACGSSVTLDAGQGFTHYNWNNGECLNRYYPVTESGTYHVIITDQNGCKNSDSVKVVMHTLPDINLGPDIILSSGDSTVLDAGSGYMSYHWSTGATTESIVVVATDQMSGVQTYTVTVTDSFGCINSGKISVNVVSSTWNNEFVYYPNPFTDELNIVSIYDLSGSQPVFYDVLGRRSYPEFIVQSTKMTISRSSLAQGCYMFYLIKNTEPRSVGKIVVF